MRKTVLGIILGFIIALPITTYAKAVVNPIEIIGKMGTVGNVRTTKVTVEEGTYRIFIFTSANGSGITSIKIK